MVHKINSKVGNFKLKPTNITFDGMQTCKLFLSHMYNISFQIKEIQLNSDWFWTLWNNSNLLIINNWVKYTFITTRLYNYTLISDENFST